MKFATTILALLISFSAMGQVANQATADGGFLCEHPEHFRANLMTTSLYKPGYSLFLPFSTAPKSVNDFPELSALVAPLVQIELPPVPLGFFCRFENNLGKKSPIPINFGTD